MTYVMSDIHGEYDKYLSMLDLISFSDSDVLFVLGDVIDRGPEPVKMLRDMSMRHNVYPVIGNHEVMAIELLGDLLTEVTDENYSTKINAKIIEKLMGWQKNGGDVTMQKFKELPNNERFELLEYLHEFSPYETIDMGNKTFILVHSGLGNFSEDKELREYTIEELAFMRPDYNRKYFADDSVFIVSGHTPTLAITGKPEIYQNNHNICIDCGATFEGSLGCLCLDNMEEYYVE